MKNKTGPKSDLVVNQIDHIFTSNDRLIKFATTRTCREKNKRIEYPKSGFDFMFTFWEVFMVTRKSKSLFYLNFNKDFNLKSRSFRPQ